MFHAACAEVFKTKLRVNLEKGWVEPGDTGAEGRAELIKRDANKAITA